MQIYSPPNHFNVLLKAVNSFWAMERYYIYIFYIYFFRNKICQFHEIYIFFLLAGIHSGNMTNSSEEVRLEGSLQERNLIFIQKPNGKQKYLFVIYYFIMYFFFFFCKIKTCVFSDSLLIKLPLHKTKPSTGDDCHSDWNHCLLYSSQGRIFIAKCKHKYLDGLPGLPNPKTTCTLVLIRQLPA